MEGSKTALTPLPNIKSLGRALSMKEELSPNGIEITGKDTTDFWGFFGSHLKIIQAAM